MKILQNFETFSEYMNFIERFGYCNFWAISFINAIFKLIMAKNPSDVGFFPKIAYSQLAVVKKSDKKFQKKI